MPGFPRLPIFLSGPARAPDRRKPPRARRPAFRNLRAVFRSRVPTGPSRRDSTSTLWSAPVRRFGQALVLPECPSRARRPRVRGRCLATRKHRDSPETRTPRTTDLRTRDVVLLSIMARGCRAQHAVFHPIASRLRGAFCWPVERTHSCSFQQIKPTTRHAVWSGTIAVWSVSLRPLSPGEGLEYG